MMKYKYSISPLWHGRNRLGHPVTENNGRRHPQAKSLRGLGCLAVIGLVIWTMACEISEPVEGELRVTEQNAEELFPRGWPFTVYGSLECRRYGHFGIQRLELPPMFTNEPLPFFRSEDGKQYWIRVGEGRVMNSNLLGIGSIWRDDPVPGYEGLKINIGPVIERARGLCD